MSARPRLVAVLLAAGAARRYGRAKQIERHAGRSFVRGAAEAAIAVTGSLIVVTGAHAELVEAELAGLPLRLVRSPDWALGMGHSIAAAFRDLLQAAPLPDAALLCLADQPLVRAAQLQRLVDAPRTRDDAIVVSDYGASRGPPCRFPACDFARLAALTGDSGARGLLADCGDRVITVAMPEGALDIDTPDDYARLRGLG
ncbi:MAG: nucleotidyltransferase family protein [Nevskia sp.]